MSKYVYTPCQDEWLRQNAPLYTWEKLAEQFAVEFGVKKNFRTLKTHCNRTLRCSPHLKGYEKGQDTGSVPIGSEYINGEGYVFVKVSDKPVHRGNQHDNWMLKQRYVYEQHYGEISEGQVVIFLDGDKTNFDINNLRLISKRNAGRVTKIKNAFHNAQITECFSLSFELEDAINEIKENTR